MWPALLLAAAAALALAYLYGLLSPVATYRDRWLAPRLLHFSFRGRKELLAGQFDQIKRDIEGHFRLATCFGLYLSPPEQAVWECVLGVQVNEGEAARVAGFLEAHPEYRESRLKTTRYVGSMLPYLNFLSFLVNTSKIRQFFELLRAEKVEPFPGLIERYHFLPLFGKKVELVNPLDNWEQWDLLK